MISTLQQLQSFSAGDIDHRPMHCFYKYAQQNKIQLTLSVSSLPISFTMKQSVDEAGNPIICAKTPFDYNIFIGVIEQVWEDGWLVFVGESQTGPAQIFLLNSADIVAVSFTPEN
jgi:hypothetical protein